MSRVIFTSLLILIGSVSSYDVYCSIKYQSTLLANEENPIGRLLIEMDGGDVALFMTVKMIGTTLVLLSLPYLRRRDAKLGWVSISCVAAFQTWLFFYLNYA